MAAGKRKEEKRLFSLMKSLMSLTTSLRRIPFTISQHYFMFKL